MTVPSLTRERPVETATEPGLDALLLDIEVLSALLFDRPRSTVAPEEAA